MPPVVAAFGGVIAPALIHVVVNTIDKLDSAHDEHDKVGILTGSAIAAVLGGTLLAVRHAHYKRLSLTGVAVDKLDAPF